MINKISTKPAPLRQWTLGEKIGEYEFVGHVGNNPKGIYKRFRCHCGAVIEVARGTAFRLEKQKNCRHCRPRNMIRKLPTQVTIAELLRRNGVLIVSL